ncbi:MAG TPA: PH domain-containing protein [Gammaproteobacteria bacterium]
MVEEQHVWSGTPSQVVNLRSFVLYGLFFWLVVPLFIIFYRWLDIKCTKYELTSQRFKTRSGILNRKLDELELYRVKDYKLDNPFFLRLFSLGNIILETSDRSHPVVIIRAIPHAEQLREHIRKCVEVRRDQKGVRELDLE